MLRGLEQAWEAGPRYAAELKKAATHMNQAAEFSPYPAMKAKYIQHAAWCNSRAEVMGTK